MALLFATSLREGVEEMRLNPFGIEFLGPLPPDTLVMFQRVIYPLVGWIKRQKRFFPNWEVEKIVHIPLRHFFNRDHYASYRLRFEMPPENIDPRLLEDFPCFIHQSHNEREVLWGATYRIVMVFLEMVFGFTPPETGSLPVVYGTLDDNYHNGLG